MIPHSLATGNTASIRGSCLIIALNHIMTEARRRRQPTVIMEMKLVSKESHWGEMSPPPHKSLETPKVFPMIVENVPKLLILQ